MRKLLFILLLLPAVAALGHDIYIFTQEQDKGFRLSDIGALWDKYHKESHDQWKVQLQEMGETINDLSPFPEQQSASITPTETAQTGYNESFTQTNIDKKDSVTTPLQQQNTVQTQTGNVQKAIGFLLEQTAVFVFAGFAAFVYFLNAFCCCICSKKSKIDDMGRPKKKGDDYRYGRK